MLVANGTPVRRRLFSLLRRRVSHLIALDGGLNALFKFQAVPDLVVGDLDSASAQALTWAKKHGAKIHRVASQDAPDFAKGLRFSREAGFKRLVVTGFAGERTDHVLASLMFSCRASGMEVVLITDDIIAFPLRGRVERAFEVPQGHTISWFAFSRAGPCSLAGVRWPFRNRILDADGFHSLSNVPVGERVHLSQRAGRSIFMVSLRPLLPL